MTVRDRLEAALAEGVRALGGGEVPDLELQRARNRLHGDYASGAGLKLARILRQPPLEIARQLAERVGTPEAAPEAAAPGYVNFRLRRAWLQALVGEVAAAGPGYGRSNLGEGERIQVEFASVNPTGPLHIGHGRGVVLGDALSRLLEFTGHEVEREYYVNDQNTQARLFGESVYARLRGEEPPERGYRGDYVTDLANQARESLPGIEQLAAEEAEARVRRFAIDRMVERLDASVRRLGVVYDEWYYESRLWNEGLPQQAIDRLREGGQLVEREGALWFRPELGEGVVPEDDRVVVRKTGEPTYFASDLGYLLSRFEERAFHRVVEVWGADHHGYVPRMKAACDALGIGGGRLIVILNQIVHLKGGSAAAGGKMSKRAGRFIELDELVDEVGADAVRYFYLLRSPDAMMEFDLDLALSRSNENPVYYAQYAHARLANLEAFAAEHAAELPERADVSLLTEPWELDLAREIAYWPETVEDAARAMEPHRIPYYVHELADRVHTFYQAGNRDWSHRVVVEDRPDMTRARLELARAARNTLESALTLVGVSAPDRM